VLVVTAADIMMVVRLVMIITIMTIVIAIEVV
jgi:hypothetical protein